MFKRGVLPNVTQCPVHDLRRTLITRLSDLGFEPFIGHKIANHVLPGVLGHYKHNEYLPQREAALKAWAERIEVAGGEAQGGAVSTAGGVSGCSNADCFVTYLVVYTIARYQWSEVPHGHREAFQQWA